LVSPPKCFCCPCPLGQKGTVDKKTRPTGLVNRGGKTAESKGLEVKYLH
jgi:hypothetical protein